MKMKSTELLQQNDFFDIAQELGQLGAWEYKLNTDEYFWSEGVYKIHDADPETFNITDYTLDNWSAPTRELFEESYAKALTEGEDYDISGEMRTLTGRHIHFRTSCRVLKDAQGNVVRLVGIFQDISNLKEQELLIETYKDALDKGSLVSVMDKEWTIKHVNSNFEKVSQYTNEELVGQSRFVFLPEDELKKLRDEAMPMLRDSGLWHGEVSNRRKDGGLYWLSTNIVALKNSSGEVEQYLGFCTDITEKKETEELLAESQRLKVIGEMAASIAHDFNNSLQSIMGNIEAAKFSLGNPTQLHKNLELIERVAFNVKDRIKALQGLGQPASSKIRRSTKAIDSLIEESVEELSPIWKDQAEKDGKTISISVESVKDGLLVGLSDGDVKNIFYNLIKNAVEAISAKGTLEISIKPKELYVEISVVDNGIGMSKEVREKVFTPFFSTKTFEVGRGLGLSGVHGLLHSVGGSINIIDSRPGEGTHIRLLLPVLVENVEVVSKNVSSVEDIQGVSVLLVEDDAAIGESSKFLLEALGLQCHWSSSALDALEELKHRSFDLILSDIGMPEMNGFQFREKVRELNIEAPFACLSGWEISEEDASRYGIEYSLMKPYNLESIKSLLFEMACKI